MGSDTVRVSVEYVEPHALADMIDVLNAAADRLAERGIIQWPGRFEEDGWRVQQLRGEAARGNVALWRIDGRPVATATLTEWADPEFAHGWPDGLDSALYLIRLARHPDENDLPLGPMMINYWAKAQTIQRGRRYLRLDCSKTNTGLHAIYKRYEFAQVGVVDLAHRKSGALFQFDTQR